MDPSCAEAYECRGESYYLLLDKVKASNDFKKYLELEGANLDAETKKNFVDRIIQGTSAESNTGKSDTGKSDTAELDTAELDTDEADTGEQDALDLMCQKLGIGEVNELLKALFIVMGLQYAIIIGCGISERNLTFGVAIREFFVKVIFLVIIIAANAMGNLNALNELDIRDIIIAIILVHEVLSILENAERLGIPVPDWLKNLLQNIKNTVLGIFGNRRE